MKINTTPGETYIVLSTGGCTATTGAGKQIKRLAAGQDFFTAMTGDTILSDDNASVAVAKGEMLSLLNTDSTGSGVQATLQFQPVASQSSLPATGENGVIYLVPNNSEAPNQYTEWVWTGAAYEQLGDVGVDLDGYVSKEELGITDIEAGETGPQVTSDATLITKAVQVDSLNVGDYLYTISNPDGRHDVTIKSTMVDLSQGSEIKLSGRSYLNSGGGQLAGLTVVKELALGTDGRSFLSSSMGNLMYLTIVGTLGLGSNNEYYLTGSGAGRLERLTLVQGLQLGPAGASDTYFLTSTGDGCFNNISLMGGLRLGYANNDLGRSCGFSYGGGGSLNRLTLMDKLALGLDDTYFIEGDGRGCLHKLTIMGSLGLYASPIAQGTEVPTLKAPRIDCELVRGGNLSVMEVLAASQVSALYFKASNSNLLFGHRASEMTVCQIGTGCAIEGVGWEQSFSDTYSKLGLDGKLSMEFNKFTGEDEELFMGLNADWSELEISLQKQSSDGSIINHVTIRPDSLGVKGRMEVAGSGTSGPAAQLRITDMATLFIGSGSTITGEGWDAIVADIQAGAAAAAAAVETEQESFTKLTFPPTGTATEEQDPSWITKKNILMQTNGGQLNMTQLTATLAYAAQTPLAIAKRTLWLSTSSGTGDAVQWPSNAVFPDDQSQDKIQQLNSNSTYWFDITYVGGSDTVLIRKVCSWAATTGESGPTE